MFCSRYAVVGLVRKVFAMKENVIYKKLLTCFEEYKKKIDFEPKVAIVLGSGLGALADEIDVKAVLNYNELPGFPVSTIPGHKGRFVFGYIEDTPVVIMQGRVHFYEGYDITDVVLPIRLMKMMGAQILFLTNAAGGVNASFAPGDFMLLEDHISSFVRSPLIGENIEELGTRFPDMSEVYDRKLRKIIEEQAEKNNIKLQHGVYLQLSGPAFESPAEIRMCRTLGADAVGMSTACEAVAAVHAGFRVCGISCISNMACGITEGKLTHAEVQEVADRVAPDFKKLIKASVGVFMED